MERGRDFAAIISFKWMNVVECLASWPVDEEIIAVSSTLSTLYCPELSVILRSSHYAFYCLLLCTWHKQTLPMSSVCLLLCLPSSGLTAAACFTLPWKRDSLRLFFLFLNVKQSLSLLFTVFFSWWNLKKIRWHIAVLYWWTLNQAVEKFVHIHTLIHLLVANPRRHTHRWSMCLLSCGLLFLKWHWDDKGGISCHSWFRFIWCISASLH